MFGQAADSVVIASSPWREAVNRKGGRKNIYQKNGISRVRSQLTFIETNHLNRRISFKTDKARLSCICTYVVHLNDK